MFKNQIFKEPMTDTQLWSVNMFTHSLRVLIAAVIAIVVALLAMLFILAT